MKPGCHGYDSLDENDTAYLERLGYNMDPQSDSYKSQWEKINNIYTNRVERRKKREEDKLDAKIAKLRRDEEEMARRIRMHEQQESDRIAEEAERKLQKRKARKERLQREKEEEEAKRAAELERLARIEEKRVQRESEITRKIVEERMQAQRAARKAEQEEEARQKRIKEEEVKRVKLMEEAKSQRMEVEAKEAASSYEVKMEQEVVVVEEVNLPSPPRIESTIESIKKAQEIRKKEKEMVRITIYEMNYREVAEYLSNRILYQDSAVNDISLTIFGAMNHILGERDENKPFSMLFSGASGVGKTQTVKELAYLFEMGEGQRHSIAFIEYRLGGMDDKMQVSVMTGASPGYVGYNETECLFDKLVKASNHYKNQKPSNPEWPFVILILFDELDKADKKIMNPLNSLLSDGVIFGPRGSKYKVPRNTRLLICFTSNFGADQMFTKNATYQDYYYGASWILDDLRVKGFPICDQSRLGKIIPFFPPTNEQLMVILVKRFYDNLAKKDAFAAKYGAADIEDDTLYRFLTSLTQHCNGNRGVREACDTLDREMAALSSKGLLHFNEQFKNVPHLVLPLNPRAKIDFETVACGDGTTKEELQIRDPNLTLALNDRFSIQAIEARIKEKSPIEYFALNHPQINQPTINVLNPVVNNYNFYFSGHSRERELINSIRSILNSDENKDEKLKLIDEIIANPLQPMQICENKTSKNPRKRKLIDLGETNQKRQKKNTDESKMITCQRCQKLKPLSAYQEMRKRGDKPYVYTHLDKCTYCRKKKNMSNDEEI